MWSSFDTWLRKTSPMSNLELVLVSSVIGGVLTLLAIK